LSPFSAVSTSLSNSISSNQYSDQNSSRVVRLRVDSVCTAEGYWSPFPLQSRFHHQNRTRAIWPSPDRMRDLIGRMILDATGRFLAIQFIFSFIHTAFGERWRRFWTVEEEIREQVDYIAHVNAAVVVHISRANALH